jgi:hypothetical protein
MRKIKYTDKYKRRIKKKEHIHYEMKIIDIGNHEIDLNLIPNEMQTWVWNNRHLSCSEIHKKTKLPRFYIRQFIYELRRKYFPKNTRSL